MMTPLLALAARTCPRGVEATLYASLYSLLNLATATRQGPCQPHRQHTLAAASQV
jgi:hypothetical protein